MTMKPFIYGAPLIFVEFMVSFDWGLILFVIPIFVEGISHDELVPAPRESPAGVKDRRQSFWRFVGEENFRKNYGI